MRTGRIVHFHVLFLARDQCCLLQFDRGFEIALQTLYVAQPVVVDESPISGVPAFFSRSSTSSNSA